mmetsp:Transcript_29857/g.48173  ORF Transcript_29857/g.48173 Transcript_29857/m.48173 type:complete len:306 (+) Transcript_29857:56-973(+)
MASNPQPGALRMTMRSQLHSSSRPMQWNILIGNERAWSFMMVGRPLMISMKFSTSVGSIGCRRSFLTSFKTSGPCFDCPCNSHMPSLKPPALLSTSMSQLCSTPKLFSLAKTFDFRGSIVGSKASQSKCRFSTSKVSISKGLRCRVPLHARCGDSSTVNGVAVVIEAWDCNCIGVVGERTSWRRGVNRMGECSSNGNIAVSSSWPILSSSIDLLTSGLCTSSLLLLTGDLCTCCATLDDTPWLGEEAPDGSGTSHVLVVVGRARAGVDRCKMRTNCPLRIAYCSSVSTFFSSFGIVVLEDALAYG